jgi:NitT/TauT family transport system substrate-binding protein
MHEPEMNRRELLKLGVATGGAATAQGILSVLGHVPRAWAGPGELQSLRSTSRSWLWGPEDFALGTGLFEKNGLKVAMAATQRGVNHDALLGGAADVLLGAPTQTMRVQVRRQPIKMICGFVNKFASNVVVKKEQADKAGVTEASPVEKKAAVLRGLRLGTTGTAAGPDQLLRYLLRKVKLDPDKDAQLVPIAGGGQGFLAALQNNQIDGFCLSSPTSDLAVEKFGAAYLFNMATNPPPELTDYLYITATVTEKTMAAKGEELTNYVKGIALALRAIDRSPSDFKEWARKWFEGMPPALFETSFTNNIGIYMKTPVPTPAQFNLNLQFLEQELKTLGQSGVPAGFKMSDAYELEFAEKALRSL